MQGFTPEDALRHANNFRQSRRFLRLLSKFRSAPVLRPAPLQKGAIGEFLGVAPDHCGSFSCAVLYRLAHELPYGEDACQLMPVAELGGTIGFASGAETGLAAGCLKSLSTFASSVGASSRNSVTGRALVKW